MLAPPTNLKRSGKYTSYHGIYQPLYPAKYRGIGLPKFKSKLEYQLMAYLDRSSAVINWTYEPFAIMYEDKSELDANRKGKLRKYFIDFIATIRSGAVIRKVWIEVKSINEVLLSKKAKRSINESKVYIRNLSKWTVAKKVAKSKGCDFIIITSNDLK